MKRRFLIRDIITKKPYFLNHRKIEFKSISSGKDFLSWMPFNLGNYYEVYDVQKDKVVHVFEKIKQNRRMRK